MKVKTVAEAWQKAGEIFPGDYMKDIEGSERAGYPCYYSTSDKHRGDHICDLNARLEVVVDGQCTNIWIEEKEEPEKPCMSRKLYHDLWWLISEREDEAKADMEAALDILDGIDHLDPDSYTLVAKMVDRVKECRARAKRYGKLLEQLELEVEP